jgi:hypothetical protein
VIITSHTCTHSGSNDIQKFLFSEKLAPQLALTPSNVRLTTKGEVKTALAVTTDPNGDLVFVYAGNLCSLTGKFEILHTDPNLRRTNGELVTAPQEFTW